MVKAVTYRGTPALEVRRLGVSAPDIDTFAFVPRLDFRDVTIGSRWRATGCPHFRLQGFYLRPTNARADDQVRRNHSTQYFAYPGYDFDRPRREAPQPILIVNGGSGGLYVDNGTDGHFRNLRVRVAVI